MGYYIMMAPCFLCGAVFSFNPHRVPSLKDKDGQRQAICLHCHTRAQETRKQHGLDPWPDPLPGAYDPADENEL